MSMDWVLETIRQNPEWFYLLTVVWTFFEGETFVFFAAIAASNGLINPFYLCLCAWLGSYCGDQTWFFAGRILGPPVLRHYPGVQSRIDMVHRWVREWGTVFVLTFRFIYGIRNFSSVAIGLSDMSIKRFMFLNFIGAGIWSLSFVLTGYFFGAAISETVGSWGPIAQYATLAGFIAFISMIVFYVRWRSRRARRDSLLPNERP